eukprot:m.51808 g.51808  ORF g.51808 m.51808 type:complete len:109 (-) comp11261_c1_seq2:62-388(-)
MRMNGALATLVWLLIAQGATCSMAGPATCLVQVDLAPSFLHYWAQPLAPNRTDQYEIGAAFAKQYLQDVNAYLPGVIRKRIRFQTSTIKVRCEQIMTHIDMNPLHGSS